MGITFYNNNCSKPRQDVKKAVYIHFCKRNIKLYSSFTEIKWELAQTSNRYPSYLKIMLKVCRSKNHPNTVSISHLSTYKNAFRPYLFIKVFSKYM